MDSVIYYYHLITFLHTPLVVLLLGILMLQFIRGCQDIHIYSYSVYVVLIWGSFLPTNLGI